MSHFNDLAKQFERLNFTQMDDVKVAKWLRDNTDLNRCSLKDTLRITKVIRKAYELGELRAKTVNNKHQK